MSSEPSARDSGRARPFRRSLIGNIVVVVLILGASLFAVSELTLTRVLEKSSSALAAQILAHIEGELNGLLTPVGATLQLTLAAARVEVLNAPDLHAVEYFLEALMTTLPQISSAELARPNGDAFMLLKDDEGWLSRQMQPEIWGYDALWRRRSSDGTVREWREPFVYEVTRRPWFLGALEHYQRAASITHGGLIAWTEPYAFATTGDPGITASAAVEGRDGELLVISLDVLLRDLSRFALDVTRSRPGQVYILDGRPGDESSQLLGVPFESSSTDGGALPILESPAAVGGVIADFSHVAAVNPIQSSEPVRFTSRGERWWGVARRAALDPAHDVWITVLIPEIELREGLPPVHRITILATLAMLVIGILLALRLARTYSEPVDALVLRSQRMERLNFELVGEPVRSSITELRQLAATFESLRQALAGFTAKREDLRIASAIHRTLGASEVVVEPPMETAGWSECSAAVGGAAFETAKCAGSRKGVAAMVFDLTGYGIETATALARLSSVFRAAIGTGADAGQTARQVLEASRHLDRPASLRFWLALADVSSMQVHVVSVGVVWLVRGADDRRPPDWYGDGELDATAFTSVPDPVVLSIEPGGCVAAFTGTVLGATNAERQRWGREGVAAALARAKGSSALGRCQALAAALQAHHDEAREDRALVVVANHAGGTATELE